MIGNQVFHCIAVLAGLRLAATQLSVPETDLIKELSRTSRTVTEVGVFEGLTSGRIMEKMPDGGESGRCPETSGPVRLVRELGSTPPGFELQETRDTITVYRRVS
ncbi:hypothetical protein [Thermomonas carbonis]|uniref:Uncharacterized protein n=1 Tax=Thermomonas carbonis TaxID=1463158 RepID=A0A7G9SN43_9GAMM|nr:hypothetical protein [Thermomonas carbonis]QNN69268.1 hypothetical protein H9L16_11355 [Thermomonas carbonis]GHC05593.1 hypothetical protein GCM10010080_19310 [Thermomonas carbonis]